MILINQYNLSFEKILLRLKVRRHKVPSKLKYLILKNKSRYARFWLIKKAKKRFRRIPLKLYRNLKRHNVKPLNINKNLFNLDKVILYNK